MFGSNSSFERKTFAKGEILLREREKLSSLYILVSGRVLNFSVKSGRVVPLYLSRDTGVIGEDCALTQDRVCHYNSIAMTNSNVIVIPRREIVTFINEGSDWIKDLIFNISAKSINTSKVIIDHQIKDDELFGGDSFSPEDEKFILDSFKSLK